MKKNEKLLEIIGEADEQLVPEIEPTKSSSKAKWFALGGGICAAALVGVLAVHNMNNDKIPVSPDVPDTSEMTVEVMESVEPVQTTTSVTDKPVTEEPTFSEEVSELPVLTDEEYAEILENHRIYPEYVLPESSDDGLEMLIADIGFGAMGMGGIWMYDISEYDMPNPWTEELQLDSLPVFRNLAYTEQIGGAPVYLTEDVMSLMAENTAASLGMTTDSIETQMLSDIIGNPLEDLGLTDAPYRVVGECSGGSFGGATIDVYGDGRIKVKFTEPISLPNGYRFNYNTESDEEGERSAAYVTELLRGLLQFDDPVSFSYNDRNIYYEAGRDYCAYDRSDDIVQDILNFNLCSAKLCPNDEGKLWLIWLNNALCAADYMGDYPIISQAEARALLLENGYISASTSSKIDEQDIAKVELIYRSSDEYILPYYCYFVDTSDEWQGDPDFLGEMREFSLCYVPAVSAEYLSDIALWDGSIN